MFTETDIKNFKDILGREKILGEIKTQRKNYPGENKNFSSLIFMSYVFSDV